jgi:polysaccharide export outer membrane protein
MLLSSRRVAAHAPAKLLATTLVALLAAGCASPGKKMPTTGPATEASLPAVELVAITPAVLAAQQAARPDAVAAVKDLLATPKPYTLGPGDILSVTVFDYPQMDLAGAKATLLLGATEPGVVTDGYAVASDGTIQFAYAGAVKVAGLTPADARTALVKQLAKYIKDPQVILRVQAYRSQRVYVDGAVQQGGPKPIDDLPMTLAEALSRAGGIAPLGDASQVTITRGEKQYVANLPRLTAAGVSPTRLLLANGDLVRVAPRADNKVFVMGEVTKPAAVELRDGSLSLNEALGEAGGMNQLSANAGEVYVVRGAGQAGTTPQVFHLNAKNPVALAYAESFPLLPKDVVFVDSSTVARFGRVVSTIVPAAASVATAGAQIGIALKR